MDFKNNYIDIFLLIFVICLILMCFNLNNSIKEEFVVNNIEYNVKPVQNPLGKQFNIDEQCETNKQFLGWKCWWRDNQSEFKVPLDNSFDNTTFKTYLNNSPLKYDGVFEL